jgi:pimeloyl-ACP methyl ester carboxylesterase
VVTHRVAVGGGRTMTVDDVGDSAGVPVLYLHGTPDSRLARPPDDGLAAAAGVRLLALDRPGYGGSDTLPAASPAWTTQFTGAVVRALDRLGVERIAVLAWSGGALSALALAAARPERVSVLAIVGGLVPREAYDEPAVRAAGGGRLDTLALANLLAPGELGETLAPLLAPYPCDRELALEHQAQRRDPAGTRELGAVRGGVERMAEALVEGVRRGLAGVAADVEAQARPLGVELAAIGCPVRLWYGTEDAVTPPAFGEWYARRLSNATLERVEGAAHYLLFTHWSEILERLVADACSHGLRG